MKGASLDGKGGKPLTPAPCNTKSSATRRATLPDRSAGLKPASPPKKNPWNNAFDTKDRKLNGSPSVLSENDPPLPTKPTKMNGAESKMMPTPKSASTSPAASAATPPPATPAHAHDVESLSSMYSNYSGSSFHLSPGHEPEARASEKCGRPRTLVKPATPSPMSLTMFNSLWRNPTGADVHARAGGVTFNVHRDIVTSNSAWFRDNLPPPNPDGSTVEVQLHCAPEAAGYCLRFMYTRRLEICEHCDPLNTAHLPRIVLSYCSAVFLRVKSLVVHTLRLMEDVARELPRCLVDGVRANGNVGGIFGEPHVHNALDLIYSQNAQHLMKPMRLAMAGVMEAAMVWLVQEPYFISMQGGPQWQRWRPMIALDYCEYRGIVDASIAEGRGRSVMPTDAELDALLDDDCLKGRNAESVVI